MSKQDEVTKEYRKPAIVPVAVKAAALPELVKAFDLLVKSRDYAPLGLRQEIEAFLKGRQKP